MKESKQINIHSILLILIRLILLNGMFVIANLPLVLVLLFTGFSATDTAPLILLLASLSFAPACIALFKSIYSLIDNSELNSYKIFYHTLKRSYSTETLPLYIIHLALFLLSLEKIILFYFPVFSLLSPIYFFLRLLCFGAYPILCIEIALFKNSIRSTLQNVLVLFFSKPIFHMINLFYFLFSLLIINELPASLILFTFSFYVYLLMSFDYTSLNGRIAMSRQLQRTE